GGADGLSQLVGYNPSTERFDATAWPPRLAELRARLHTRAQESLYPGSLSFGVTIEEDAPAIVGMRPGEFRDDEGVPGIGGWTIVELDIEYISKELLPELARKQFASDYNVAVVSRADAGRVIFGTPTDHPDATAGLLDFRDGGPGRIRAGFGFVTRFG